ncbi:MAG: translation initiation factor IF-3 [Planctomycetota bacterium]
MGKSNSNSPNHRINERIKSDMVRLVYEDGEHVGIVSRDEAIKRAQEQDKDLVEVAPDADPPVCKVLDYGKFKYRQKKRRQKQKQSKSELKEIRIGLATEEHDLGFKADRVREFLEDHNKVLISMRLGGREKAYGDEAKEKLREFAERFDDVGKIERPPTRESAGRITTLLSPK